MTPRSRPAPGRPARAKARRGSRARVVGFVTVLAVLAAGTWWFFRVRHRAPPSAPTPAQALVAADSVELMVKQERYVAAIPYVRIIESQMPAADPRFDTQFAGILCNAALEKRTVDGVFALTTRSSAERVALIREALMRIERADGIAPSTEMRRDVAVMAARVLSVWGFQREAYGEFRRAHATMPLGNREAAEARWVERMMADPTAVLPPPPGALSGPVELAPR